MVVGMVMGVHAAMHFGWWEWEGRERRDGDIWKCTFSKAMRNAPVKPTASFLFNVTVPKSRYESGQEGQEVGWLGWWDRELTCGRLAKGRRCWLVVKNYGTGRLSLLVPLDLFELLGVSIPRGTLGERGLHIHVAHLPWHCSETCLPARLAFTALALEQLRVDKRRCVFVSLLGPDQVIGAHGRTVASSSSIFPSAGTASGSASASAMVVEPTSARRAKWLVGDGYYCPGAAACLW